MGTIDAHDADRINAILKEMDHKPATMGEMVQFQVDGDGYHGIVKKIIKARRKKR